MRENQFAFMHGRFITKFIVLLKRLNGIYKDRKKDLHKIFINLEMEKASEKKRPLVGT